MGDFIKCEKGHIYDSRLGECPFCSGKSIEEKLKDLPEIKNVDLDALKKIANCYLTGPKDF